MADDAQVYEGLKAALNVSVAPTQALDADEHTGLDIEHVQLGLGQRFFPTERAGRASRTAYRATTRVVAHTASNARTLQKRAAAAVDGVAVPVGADEATTPVRLESQDAPAPDDGMFSALTTWTFTLTRRNV